MSTIQLTYYCDSCKAENHLETKAPTRSELENIRGSYFYEQCNKCLKSHRYHVNDVKAKSNMNLIFLLIHGLVIL